jgi:hypothetical protein
LRGLRRTFEQLLLHLLLHYSQLLLSKLCTLKALQYNAWALRRLYHLGSDALYDSTGRLARQQLLFQAARLLFCWRWQRCLLL